MNAAPFPKESSADGHFVRQASAFRRWIGQDSGLPAVAGRYRLYVSLACPWAHRTLIYRTLKGLDAVISLAVVDPIRDARGWAFAAPDEVEGFSFLSEAYQLSDPSFNGRVTVPVLWDTQTRTIVNNESADIIRMLDSAFAGLVPPTPELYPVALRAEIDALNERVYHSVNNGVYRAGFATSQAAYDEAVAELFATLAWLEERLQTRRFLCGPRITEADWRLFTTLVRFDPVYHTHFKCNRRQLQQFPRLWEYTRDLYQQPGVEDTVDFDHIRRHYYVTHKTINPSGIVPVGPELDFHQPVAVALATA